MLAADRRVEMVGRARNGQEAVSRVASLEPDAILMDLQMPIMGGVEAIRCLRERRSAVRIMVVTGADEEGLIPEARAAGADAFVTKPPVAAPLIAAVLAEAPRA